MKQVAKRFKIKTIRTTAYHPQSNGSLERSHLVLAEYLKQYTTKDEDWDQWLELACFSYNTSVHESSKYTPFELIFGRTAITPSAQPPSEQDKLPTYQNYMTDLISRLVEIRKLAHDNLLAAKLRSKYYYDQKANPQNFRVGSSVFLLKGPKPGKLGDRYSGPHQVLQILKNHNIKIKMGKKNKIVHSNRLKTARINAILLSVIE